MADDKTTRPPGGLGRDAPLGGAALEALRQRLAATLALIAAASAKRPQGAPPVRLLAASKHQPVAAVCALCDAGVTDFAENYVQEMVQKAAAVAATGRRVRWHLVGALQRNKAASAVTVAHALHGVDSLRLIQRLTSLCPGRSEPLQVLVQIDLAATPQPKRAGVPAAAAAELAAAVLAAPGLALAGLMTVAPQGADAATAFAELAKLGRRVAALPGGAGATALSMGMSGDFSAAIAAGATMVRIGRALFGPRPTNRGAPSQ